MSDVFVDSPYYNPNKPPVCQDKEHEAPNIDIPEGKMLRHTCPTCGVVEEVDPAFEFNFSL